MTKQRGGTLGPGLPYIPNAPPPRVLNPGQPAITPSALAPGMMLTTNTEAFLVLRTLGEGGTARAFLAIRVRTAQFSDPRVILPTPPTTPGITTVLPQYSDLLATLEEATVTCALKVSLIPRGDPAYEA
ncbi:hypothetical protein HY480_02365, partial [Candidatus Uhrbacteria bacterium]|nr:hypothetical protein [Candidatus Uhrbacteria bacterium]